MAPIISIENLGLAHEQSGVRTEILAGLNLAVAPGEFVAIVGASGVGKSTLLRVLMGLHAPSSGSVEIRATEGAERRMALVFQDARLLPWRRVDANVAFGLEKSRLSAAEKSERVREALRNVGLEGLGRRFPHQLSGGQRQRVALARALAVQPAILLMDEPFSALDAPTRRSLQDELIRLQRDYKKTILFVTHDMEEAIYLADRVIALGGAPAGVTASVQIPAPRPRRRDDPALAALSVQMIAALHDYVGAEAI